MSGGTLLEFSRWLGRTALSHGIQASGWVIPTLQTIHILAIAALFSSAILVDLRALGVLQRDATMPEVARRFLPLVWPVLLVLLLTGALLIVGEPRRALLNSTFYLKMSLVLVAIALTAALQRVFASAAWDRGPAWRLGSRCAALLSILAWCGVIFAGRWIAYTQVG